MRSACLLWVEESGGVGVRSAQQCVQKREEVLVCAVLNYCVQSREEVFVYAVLNYCVQRREEVLVYA